MNEMIITSPSALSFEEARQFISSQLNQWDEVSSSDEQWPCYIRIQVPLVEGISASEWLAQQILLPKIYWLSRDGNFEIAGVGTAYQLVPQPVKEDIVSAWSSIEKLIQTSANLRVFFGASFHGTSVSAEWGQMGCVRFLVPRFELFNRDGQGCMLACNIVFPEGGIKFFSHIRQELFQLKFVEDCSSFNISVLSRLNQPHYEDWDKLVAETLAAITQNKIKKVVLARRVQLELQQRINPVKLAIRLLQEAPYSYGFLFQFEKDRAFLGASPEMLYQRMGQKIRAEAMAGTRPFGNDPVANELMRQELLSSRKEQHEHRLVVQAIREAFRQICRSYKLDKDGQVIQLKNQQHFLMRLSGTLKTDIRDRDIYHALHPTPAVGGYPKDNALMLIRQLENFDRGWFAGTVGYLSRETAEMAVAIRSCLVEKNFLHVFGGAGIVRGSRALNEWEEIDAKIKNFIDIAYGH